MAERQRDYANNLEDEELQIDVENNAMVIDADDDERIADDLEEIINNSEDESMGNSDNGFLDDSDEPITDDERIANDIEMINNSEEESVGHSDNGVLDDSDQPITDAEDDLADSSEEEAIVDVGEILDGNAIDDDFVNEFAEIFSVNIEGEGLDDFLVARGNGRLQAMEQFILIIAKALRYKESYVSMLTNFEMANLGYDNANFPRNMRDFWSMVNRRDDQFTNVIVCTICWQELGHGKKPTIHCLCGQCGPEQTNSELGTFLYINLASQIRGLLSKPGMERDLQYPYTRRKRHANAIEDVYDGAEYRRLSQEGQFLWRGSNNYSLAMWTDGVSPVKSANVGIWPVFLQILELSPRARQRNSLLAAVYVGPRTPRMGHFLIPVTESLRDLCLNGVTWRPNGGEERVSRFMTLLVSADSEGRYPVFGMMRHNAANGCTFCYAEGERIGPHQPPIYRYNDNNAADRTDAEIRQDAEIAHEMDEPQRGVRAVSAMSIVPGFDLRSGQLVEAMHCLWEGIFVRLFNNLLDANIENNITPRELRIISSRITSIKTPTKLSRLPRDLTRFANFTATE